VLSAATVFNPTSTGWNSDLTGYSDALLQVALHEIGHTMGLGDQYGMTPNTVMNQFNGVNDSSRQIPDTIQTCDNSEIKNSTFYPAQTSSSGSSPSPISTCEPTTTPPASAYDSYEWDASACEWIEFNADHSPILIDVAGEGFHLTSAADGVTFDINGDGHPIPIAWTSGAYQNAFLALDRNGNGVIDSGKELFGNATAQPPSEHPNGFLALAEFDKPENGGNGDGVIDARDAVYSHLLLWIDANHDGISQPEELHSLPEMGVISIDLKYVRSDWVDEFGNHFRYRGKANAGGDPTGDPVDRTIYDVFFVGEDQP
jgi:hypothetical protein